MNISELERRLLLILDEIQKQREVGNLLPTDMMNFDDQLRQMREYIDVGESSIAYECLTSLLKLLPFKIDSRNAVALVEIGLIFGFKTKRS